MPQTQSHLQRSLRLSTLDGAAYSFMVGVGETFLPAFALAMSLGEVNAGLLTVVPMLIGAFLQLISPTAVRRYRSAKRWVLAAAALQALSFLPLILVAGTETRTFWIVFIASTLYWTGGLGAGAAWNLWMAKTVPKSIRPQYFSFRGRVAHLGVLVGLIVGSLIAEQGKVLGHPLQAFAIMFTLGLLARGVCVVCLHKQHEPDDIIMDQKFLGPWQALKELWFKSDGKILKYLLFVQVCVNISGPFFSPYMLSELALDYHRYMVLVATSFLTRAFTLPLMTRIAPKMSSSKMLKIGGLLIIPSPMLWMFSDNFWWLILVQIQGGVCWAIYEMGMTLSFFDGIKHENRTSLLTYFNLSNAVAMAVGGFFGGEILREVGIEKSTYFLLFVLSSSGRVLALIFLVGLKDIRNKALPFFPKIFSVRPNRGALSQPLFEDEDESQEEIGAATAASITAEASGSSKPQKGS